MADAAEKRAKSVAEQVRARALAVIAKHDASLASVYDQVAEGVRRDLRAAGYSVESVRKIIEKHFDATLPARQKIIEDAILSAAREARVLPQATFDAVYGQEATSAEALPFAPASPQTPKLLRRRPRASEDEPR